MTNFQSFLYLVQGRTQGGRKCPPRPLRGGDSPSLKLRAITLLKSETESEEHKKNYFAFFQPALYEGGIK